MRQVYLSIGSNINRRQTIQFALARLRHYFGELIQSNTYQNKSFGFEGDDFFNLVIGFSCNLPFKTLSQTIKSIEVECGRTTQEKQFSSRILDIDILLFGSENYQPTIDIPREEITKYVFVLQPLAEIAGNVIHPTLKKTIAEIWAEFDQKLRLDKKIDLSLDGT